ncbi:MAG: 3-hydroxyacyl-(acyl-carrier-protein) dehydratase FabZ [Thermotogae bacterium ADurb.Bin062]|nr:MAG: 3-hydroxyacyl-(acyl-carrier-protein) dehydratase FabZ [Thermotogota bacterium ADurb.Bin062]
MRNLNIDEIKSAIPHRYPFLMVDRVTQLEPDRIQAYKNVTVNEPYFQGHFPHYPIVPAVLQLEGIAQTAALLLHDTYKEREGIPLFLGIDSARFLREVRPGDRMDYVVEVKQKMGDFYKVNGQVLVEGQVAARCTLFVGVKFFDPPEAHV